MLRRRTALPLSQDQSSTFLPWVIALMVFLVALALAAVMALSNAINRWDRDLSGNLTVQITPVEEPAPQAQTPQENDARRLQAVTAVLKATPEVVQIRPLSHAAVIELLRPWLGPATGIDDLPLPQVIDVVIATGARPDIDALGKRLTAAVPGTIVDDHRLWLDRLVKYAWTIETIAIAVVVLVALVAIGVVIFTTITRLTIHRNAVSLLHLIGAPDDYVAAQFEGQALRLGVGGGLIGLLLAAGALLGLGHAASGFENSLLPIPSLGAMQWAGLATLPLASGLIAKFTARFTVLRTLGRMI